MSKRIQNDEDQMVEQDFDYYCYPPMFRCSPEDDFRAQQGGAGAGMAGGGMAGGMAGTGIPPAIEPTVQDVQYTQGFLRTMIGRRMRITFLIGTNMVQDRVGVLEQVGVSYVVLRQEGSNVRIFADLYSIKFIDIYPM